MNFEIIPSTDIRSISLKLGRNYMEKDEAENSYFASLTARDGIFDTFYEKDGALHRLRTNREQRLVASKNLPLRFCLSEKGADLLRTAYHALGPLRFAFYRDDQDPLTAPSRKIPINMIAPGFPLEIGTLFSVD